MTVEEKKKKKENRHNNIMIKIVIEKSRDSTVVNCLKYRDLHLHPAFMTGWRGKTWWYRPRIPAGR